MEHIIPDQPDPPTISRPGITWNGSADSSSAFVHSLARYLVTDGKDTLIYEWGAAFNTKNYKMVFSSHRHFHKYLFCLQHGLAFDVNKPFTYPTARNTPAQPLPPQGAPQAGPVLPPLR